MHGRCSGNDNVLLLFTLSHDRNKHAPLPVSQPPGLRLREGEVFGEIRSQVRSVFWIKVTTHARELETASEGGREDEKTGKEESQGHQAFFPCTACTLDFVDHVSLQPLPNNSNCADLIRGKSLCHSSINSYSYLHL